MFVNFGWIGITYAASANPLACAYTNARSKHGENKVSAYALGGRSQANESFMMVPNHLYMSSKLSPLSLAASASESGTPFIVRVVGS